MGKIYDLYSPDQRKIDSLKRRIKGYQKTEKDLTSQNRKVNNDNRKLKAKINSAIDKLYCWGEILDAKFQKEMLEILKGDKE